MLRTWPRVRRVVASSKWLAGVILAAVPIIYGIICIQRGHATLFGRRAASLDVSGKAGFWLAASYIAVGSFLHFHYFWGLSERLWRFSQAGKFTSGARLFAELPLRSLSHLCMSRILVRSYAARGVLRYIWLRTNSVCITMAGDSERAGCLRWHRLSARLQARVRRRRRWISYDVSGYAGSRWLRR